MSIKETKEDVVIHCFDYVKDKTNNKNINNDDFLSFIEKEMKKIIDKGDRRLILKKSDEEIMSSLKSIYDDIAQMYYLRRLMKLIKE